MKSNAERQAAWRAAQKAQGRRRFELWVNEDEKLAILLYLKKRRTQRQPEA